MNRYVYLHVSVCPSTYLPVIVQLCIYLDLPGVLSLNSGSVLPANELLVMDVPEIVHWTTAHMHGIVTEVFVTVAVVVVVAVVMTVLVVL